MSRTLTTAAITAAALFLVLTASIAQVEEGFVSLFNGENLDGWTGGSYVVEDGVLVCPAQGGGLILSDKEYSDFIFRFDVKLPPGGNNGVAIRNGLEIQILDDYAAQYANLQPYQYHGSVYGVVPAERGALKPAGEWNEEEIRAVGSRIMVVLNGQVIVDTDLGKIEDPGIIEKHPAIRNTSGHIGFMGHGSRIEFRNLRIKEPPLDDIPPLGFTALFDGKDLAGWRGLVADPPKRAAMSEEELATAQAAADQRMRDHWRVEDGALVFDGKGDSLCTARDYADFEMYVDWKILENGDSGIYLRGSPQVQIWQRDVGSGGLYNNQNNPSNPIKNADNPIEQWNTFRIRMIGEKVWVWLNQELVVDNVTMENYWERDKPIYPSGQIELQNHGNTLWFKNIYLKEISEGEGGQTTGDANGG